MLTQLTIKNYALIRQLEISPSSRLTVITGETGAGKSIMLGALGLLMGNRADTKVLWDDQEKCVTEGVFSVKNYPLRPLFEENDLDFQDPTIIRREISPGGKSRAFINDTPVTLDVMRKIGSRLMDIHSQHETLELGNHRFQLDFIDSFAGNHLLLSQYREAWVTYLTIKKAYEERLAESSRLKAEYDFIKFQLEELQKASFEEGEQSKLESQLKISEHGEDIKTRLNQLIALLGQSENSIQSQLSEAHTLLVPIRNFSPAYEQLTQRIDSIRIELKDILQEAESEEEGIEFDPRKRKEVQERLDLLYTLLQKHRLNDIEGLLALTRQLEEQVAKTVSLDEDLNLLLRKFQQQQQLIDTLAEQLSVTRQKVFVPLCKQLIKLLQDLGIPEAKLQVESSRIPAGPFGGDQVEILFSANKGIAPRPLVEVASGGEFSRLMFCVKYVMAEKTALPTLVLDEIDTGVSGEIAIQLGKMMKAMAKNHQLITISHLPQIAARGDVHLLVYKDSSDRKTVSEMKTLNEHDRVAEIAKMIGGAKPSALAIENAKEMLQTRV